jgi:hypothetical protein
VSDKPWQRLSQSQQETRIKAARVVSAQRLNPNLSLNAAARRERISPQSVLKYFGRWYQRDPNGTLHPLPYDTEPFLMNVYSTRGVVEVEVPDSDARSLVGRHTAAVLQFRDTGSTAQLGQFTGRRVGDVTLETDPKRLLAMVFSGPDFLELYTT